MDTYTVLNVLSAYAVEKNDFDLRRQLNIPPNKLFVNPDFEDKLDKVINRKKKNFWYIYNRDDYNIFCYKVGQVMITKDNFYSMHTGEEVYDDADEDDL